MSFGLGIAQGMLGGLSDLVGQEREQTRLDEEKELNYYHTLANTMLEKVLSGEARPEFFGRVMSDYQTAIKGLGKRKKKPGWGGFLGATEMPQFDILSDFSSGTLPLMNKPALRPEGMVSVPTMHGPAAGGIQMPSRLGVDPTAAPTGFLKSPEERTAEGLTTARAKYEQEVGLPDLQTMQEVAAWRASGLSEEQIEQMLLYKSGYRDFRPSTTGKMMRTPEGYVGMAVQSMDPTSGTLAYYFPNGAVHEGDPKLTLPPGTPAKFAVEVYAPGMATSVSGAVTGLRRDATGRVVPTGTTAPGVGRAATGGITPTPTGGAVGTFPGGGGAFVMDPAGRMSGVPGTAAPGGIGTPAAAQAPAPGAAPVQLPSTQAHENPEYATLKTIIDSLDKEISGMAIDILQKVSTSEDPAAVVAIRDKLYGAGEGIFFDARSFLRDRKLGQVLSQTEGLKQIVPNFNSNDPHTFAGLYDWLVGRMATTRQQVTGPVGGTTQVAPPVVPPPPPPKENRPLKGMITVPLDEPNAIQTINTVLDPSSGKTWKDIYIATNPQAKGWSDQQIVTAVMSNPENKRRLELLFNALRQRQ